MLNETHWEEECQRELHEVIKCSGSRLSSLVATNHLRLLSTWMWPSRFCIHYVSKSGRPRSGHRTGKGQSSSQFPRRVVPKNVLTSGQSHSSPMLVKSCLKSSMLGFSIMWTQNFQMSKLGLEKAEELEIKSPTFVGL